MLNSENNHEARRPAAEDTNTGSAVRSNGSIRPPRLEPTVAFILVGGFVALFLWTLYVLNIIDRSMEIYDLGKETTRLASTLYFDKMTAIAQLTIVLLGGAWALVTFKEIRVRPKGWTGVTCFILANFAFGLSLIVYGVGYDFLVTRIFHHGTFDIDAPFIYSISLCQQVLFLKGCVDLLASIFLGGRSQ